MSRYAETQSPSDAAAEEHQAAQGQPRTDHMTAGTGGTLTPPHCPLVVGCRNSIRICVATRLLNESLLKMAAGLFVAGTM